MIKISSAEDLPFEGGAVRFRVKSTNELKVGQIPERQNYFIEEDTKVMFTWQEVSEYECIGYKGMETKFQF